MSDTRTAAEVSPSWAELIARAIEDRLASVHTGLPGYVESYDAESQSASIQPSLERAFQLPDDSIEVQAAPILYRIPVVFQGGNGWRFRFRLKAGDEVFLAFAERSLDRWKDSEQGSTVDPVESRKHDLSDAIAIPNLRRRGSALPDPGDDFVIDHEDGDARLVLKPDGTIELGVGASASVPLGEALSTWLTTQLTVSTAFGPSGPSTVPLTSEQLSSKVKVTP